MDLKPALVPVARVKKPAAASAKKAYPPHEHFGSPLNVCRICGEKYSYTQKPFAINGLSSSKN